MARTFWHTCSQFADCVEFLSLYASTHEIITPAHLTQDREAHLLDLIVTMPAAHSLADVNIGLVDRGIVLDQRPEKVKVLEHMQRRV